MPISDLPRRVGVFPALPEGILNPLGVLLGTADAVAEGSLAQTGDSLHPWLAGVRVRLSTGTRSLSKLLSVG